jgi:hypothetical protein
MDFTGSICSFRMCVLAEVKNTPALLCSFSFRGNMCIHLGRKSCYKQLPEFFMFLNEIAGERTNILCHIRSSFCESVCI